MPNAKERALAANRRWYKRNRKREIQRSRAYQKAHPEVKRAADKRYRDSHWERHLKQAYGLSRQAYTALLKKQRGVCSICHKRETQKKRGKIVRLAVDHCHKTGKVRGLLCARCNMALGQFHSVSRLNAVRRYLTASTRGM